MIAAKRQRKSQKKAIPMRKKFLLLEKRFSVVALSWLRKEENLISTLVTVVIIKLLLG